MLGGRIIIIGSKFFYEVLGTSMGTLTQGNGGGGVKIIRK